MSRVVVHRWCVNRSIVLRTRVVVCRDVPCIRVGMYLARVRISNIVCAVVLRLVRSLRVPHRRCQRQVRLCLPWLECPTPRSIPLCNRRVRPVLSPRRWPHPRLLPPGELPAWLRLLLLVLVQRVVLRRCRNILCRRRAALLGRRATVLLRDLLPGSPHRCRLRMPPRMAPWVRPRPGPMPPMLRNRRLHAVLVLRLLPSPRRFRRRPPKRLRRFKEWKI
jgi:hypothetical protein